jgi:hypothetical protein
MKSIEEPQQQPEQSLLWVARVVLVEHLPPVIADLVAVLAGGVVV